MLVLCECHLPSGEPAEGNERAKAAKLFEADESAEPWYGIEQEYTLFQADGTTPVGFPKQGFPQPQGPYYCGAGTGKACGRQIAEAHLRACLHAGLQVGGINAEVMPGQWEFQVGPCTGVDAGDQLQLARYILERVSEDFGVIVSLDPKPVQGDWNGAGAHCNFSTKAMRKSGGYEVVMDAVRRLEPVHEEFMAAYGEGNERRLTGSHETASIKSFSYGVADRGASVRIPRVVEREGKGFLEDRRPASNVDPYRVTSMLFRVCHLEAQE